jgi:hypothetical protein
MAQIAIRLDDPAPAASLSWSLVVSPLRRSALTLMPAAGQRHAHRSRDSGASRRLTSRHAGDRPAALSKRPPLATATYQTTRLLWTLTRFTRLMGYASVFDRATNAGGEKNETRCSRPKTSKRSEMFTVCLSAFSETALTFSR